MRQWLHVNVDLSVIEINRKIYIMYMYITTELVHIKISMIYTQALSAPKTCVISTPWGVYRPHCLSLLGTTYRTHYHLRSTRYIFAPEKSEARRSEVPCPMTNNIY